MSSKTRPPKLPLHFFQWFCRPEIAEDIEGDLVERFNQNNEKFGLRKARRIFIWQVLLLLRPGIIRSLKIFDLNPNYMIVQYLKISWRGIKKNTVFSLINIGGLMAGMTVSILIALWVWDELSFNKTFKNYENIGQLFQNRTFDGSTGTYAIVPQPMSQELRENYPDFQATCLAVTQNQILSRDDLAISAKGMYVEPSFPEMFSMEIIKGKPELLQGVHEIMLSESEAKALFGGDSPIGKTIKLANRSEMEISAVYRDFAANTTFNKVAYLAPWSYYRSINEFVRNTQDSWGSNDYQCYVQLSPDPDWSGINHKVKDIFYAKISEDETISKPELILHPMSKWHLYNTFKDGVNTGGTIDLVWLFGIIGVFVMVLACINFMNLSTVQSEKRSKEIGVRKAIGSPKRQLVYQFLCESFLITFLAFILASLLVTIMLSPFNDLTGKEITLPLQNGLFWFASAVFILLTSLLAGSYPAFYLSEIKAINNLKKAPKRRHSSILPRKVLVVLQFTISITLIIGTLIIYQQIQFIKNRPVGYDNTGLIYLEKNTPALQNLDHDILRNQLLATGVVQNVSESANPITSAGFLQTDFDWEGKNPSNIVLINTRYVTSEFGRTIGFQLLSGRDFSEEFGTDQEAVVINETAARLLSFDHPVGSIIKRSNNKSYQIIGVVKDVIDASPYQTTLPSMYFIDYTMNRNFINIKIKPEASTGQSINQVKELFSILNPSSPFDFTFVDEAFAEKFADEERIGKLSLLFSVFAIFISLLGLFGLASFIAERRTKEISVRKVLGATVLDIWSLLSGEFILLVLISIIIAFPIAWFYMRSWFA
ncbi:MAG: ABC transporter permease [Saprospiraceae bacterium]|nr:ABC transporter permease [Saprospiraceae bacterium]